MPKHARKPAGYVPPAPATCTVHVTDERPELGRKRPVASFERVSGHWRAKDIIEYFGIAEHLHVVRVENGKTQVIQEGRR